MDNFVKKLKSLNISLGIGETSRISGATTTQIRYWEKKGLIQSIQYEEGKNKRYSLKNITSIIFIKTMMDEGYTLQKAADKLQKHTKNSDSLHMMIHQRLESIETNEQSTKINFGRIDNDPQYNIIAEIKGKNVQFLKKPARKN